jgi:hypothetical protein
MSPLHFFAEGGYFFLEGGFPYSQGVIAGPGYAFHRVRFSKPLPMNQGFSWIRNFLTEQKRPLTALASCELRSPVAFTMQGFQDFNKAYVDVLHQWEIFRNQLNPVGRSNLAPKFDPPGEPGFYAFTYTVPEQSDQPKDWVIAGSGEWPEDQPFPEAIVARGDLSPQGISAKANYVLDTMQARARGLGADWSRLTSAQIYTVHDFSHLISSEFAARGMLGPGLSWHICTPPILELDFEMDVRSVRQESVVVLS